jgi:replicative DNA helicase
MRRLDHIVADRSGALLDLQDRKARGESVLTGTPTGFAKFDADHGGLPKTLCVLGADTGVGKSAFLRAFTLGAARSGAGDVVLLNLEDGNDNYADRLLGERTGIGASKVRRLEWLREDGARLDAVAQDQTLKRIYVEDNQYDVNAFADAAREHHAKRPICLVGIDYLQLLRVRGVTNNTDRIAQALLALQKLAKDLEAPVLALSQLSRKKVMDRGYEHFQRAKQAGEKGDALYEGFAPMGGDFHWASEIDQFAKLIIGVHRPGPYKRLMEQEPDRDTKASMYLLKNNFGPCTHYTVGWHGPTTRAYDL